MVINWYAREKFVKKFIKNLIHENYIAHIFNLLKMFSIVQFNCLGFESEKV